jgi:hypothetical protein
MLSTLVLIYLVISVLLAILVWAALIAAKKSDIDKERNLRAVVFRAHSNRGK